MALYYGRVKDGVIVLPPDVSLADGTTVEVRVAETPPTDERAAGEAAKRRLLALGLLTEIKEPPSDPDARRRTPIEVKGQPLSEMIVEERR
jgi:hypothetical protein